MLSFVKKNWLSLITFTLTITILVIALTAGGNAKNNYIMVKNADMQWFLLAALMILLYWLSDALSLHVLTLLKSKKYSFASSFRTAILGLLYSAITPFATGGQAVQIYDMRKNDIETGVASSIITIKSFVFQLGMLGYAVVCSLFAWKLFDSQVENFELYMVFGIVCNVVFLAVIVLICVSKKVTVKLAAAIIYILRKLRIVKDSRKTLSDAIRQIKVFRKSMYEARKDLGATLFCVLITVIQLTFFFAIPYCIYRAFHLNNFSIWYFISANAIITMITAFVPLPGGSVAAEGSFYIFFSIFFPSHLIIVVTVIWRVATYYSCIAFGAVMSLLGFLMKPKSKREAI